MTQTEDSVLLVEQDEGIATVTLNRPEAMNALSRRLRAELTGALGGLAADPEVGVVILTGAGRAFCAGLDLKELGGETAPDPGASRAVTDADVIRALRECPVPLIGAVNGFAITGGFELALACDFLIASSAARFADTHARVGLVPGWGLSQLLPRRIGIGRAKEMSFTGNFIDAQQAERWGLVNRVVAPDVLIETCRSLARDILSCDRDTLRRFKRVYDEGAATTLAEGLQIEGRVSREHAQALRPEAVAERRHAIQDRGRRQSRGE